MRVSAAGNGDGEESIGGWCWTAWCGIRRRRHVVVFCHNASSIPNPRSHHSSLHSISNLIILISRNHHHSATQSPSHFLNAYYWPMLLLIAGTINVS
jgi:hypothetical protein